MINRDEFIAKVMHDIGEFNDITLKCPPSIKPWLVSYDFRPKIKKVIFNAPATIVIWSDGTKTVVKCQEGDTYSKEMGLALCIAKNYLGNKSNFNNEFKKWIPKEEEPLPSVEEMRSYIKKYCGRHPCSSCVIRKLSKHTACHCYREPFTSDSEIIKNYKAIKESERHAK